MAIVWSPLSGRMKVGIDVRTSAITSATTSITLYVDYYIRVESWRYDDRQNLGMAVTGLYFAGEDFHNYQASPGTYQWLQKTLTFPNRPIRYGGGPTIQIGASISGAYDGSSPGLVRNWTYPARPASVPGVPGVSISNVTASSAKVNLTAPASNGSAIVQYQAQVSTNSGFTGVVATLGGTGTVSGLNAATTYYVRARARNGVGWGSYSTTKTFTTGATVPAAPSSVAVSSIGQISASIGWTAPSNGGSAIEDYTIQIATNSGFTSGLQTITDEASPYVADLSPGTTYWTRVRANNGVGSGAYSTAVSFTTLAGTPVIITPAQSATQTAGIASLTVESVGITGAAVVTAEFSKDITFATGVSTSVLNLTGPTSNSRYTWTDPAVVLSNGTWYVRVKVDNTVSGYTTPWSDTRTFTQSHSPVATPVSPIADATVRYEATTTFTWRFIDSAAPNDWQTAYRLVIENNQTGEVVHDSAKTALISSPSNNTITRSVAIPVASKANTLRWRVMVWDRLDQASPWSAYSLFTVADPPVVTIVEPTSLLPVDSGAPTFIWSTSILSGGTQSTALIRVFDSDTSELVWSRTIHGAGNSITPGSIVFANNKSYYYSITVTDSKGLVGTASESFNTSYEAPDEFSYDIDASQANNEGYILVDWSSANADPLFTSWKVYRRESGDQWELMKTFTDQNIRTYTDYMIEAGKTYAYTVTQTGYRSGDVLESSVGYHVEPGGEIVVETREFTPELSHYWLVNPDIPSLSVRLENVTSDANTLEFEKSSYTIIGRGRHVDYGDELGYVGTLTCQVRGTENQSSFRLAMEALRRSQETYYLRTPFGRLFPVALGDIGWSPLPGTGTMEMGDLTIPYEEVAV